MKVKPILFNTEIVKAILAGSKTQMRRVVRCKDGVDNLTGYSDIAARRFVSASNAVQKAPCSPGDILWVRETWCNIPVSPGGHFRFGGRYYYKADGDIRPDGWKGNWRPSVHMPKEAARIFLRVKDVRVERLQDMTEDDAIVEGIPDTPADTSSPLERF